jgi:hypothetical protein
MFRVLLVLAIAFVNLLSIGAYSQQVVVSGFISASESSEALINATVYNSATYRGVASNNYGYYSIAINAGEEVELKCSYVGYIEQSATINALNDTIINFFLTQGIELDEVAVFSDKYSHLLERPVFGTIEMEAALVEKLPGILGEMDLARMLHLMPGVQSGKEGSSGINVRGGSNDQNLMLLDGMPVYNATHLGGFISVFNPLAVSNIKLHKGAFPAKYGGRLSSILDVSTKDGSLQKKSRGYSIGTLTTSFFYESPLIKDTSSFIISGRRTLFDLLISGYNLLDSKGEKDAGYNLWDINIKYNKKINPTTRYYLSFYMGRDNFFRWMHDVGTSEESTFKSSGKYKNNWGNTLASLRVYKIYGSKLFANYTFGMSNYKYGISNSAKMEEDKGYSGTFMKQYHSKITDLISNADFEYRLNSKHDIRFGIHAALHTYKPAKYSMSRTENGISHFDSVWGAGNNLTPELSVYVSDDIIINKRLSGNVGLRFSNFFAENSTYSGLEPRVVFNYRMNRQNSLKASFTRMSQFIHLVSTNNQAFSSDLWFPSNANIKPETSWQYSTGSVSKFGSRNELWFSFDLYYKTFNNLLELTDGASILTGTSKWEDMLVGEGKGYVVGSEFLLEKKSGKATGWIAYTLSKNMRRFSKIDNGEWFPFKYDRRHELSFVMNYQINKKVHFSANWVYMSGEALTLPQYKYLLDMMTFGSSLARFDTFQEAHCYGSRNSFRTPPYHRLDFSFNFVNEDIFGKRTFSLGLYNAYNSTNPYYYYFANNAQGELKLHALTLFPIIPSISYSYKF